MCCSTVLFRIGMIHTSELSIVPFWQFIWHICPCFLLFIVHFRFGYIVIFDFYIPLVIVLLPVRNFSRSSSIIHPNLPGDVALLQIMRI